MHFISQPGWWITIQYQWPSHRCGMSTHSRSSKRFFSRNFLTLRCRVGPRHCAPAFSRLKSRGDINATFIFTDWSAVISQTQCWQYSNRVSLITLPWSRVSKSAMDSCIMPSPPGNSPITCRPCRNGVRCWYGVSCRGSSIDPW